MNIKKLIIALFISLFALQICYGQNEDFERNWFKDTKGTDDFYSRYDYKNYTKEDVEKAIIRFHLIKALSSNNDEWEGIYSYGTMIGISELHWNPDGGFVIFYVYHTLGSLDFGTASTTKDLVKFQSEKSPSIKRNSIFSTNLVKVKFGDRHFLVPENRLKNFAERAVGLSIDLEDWNYYLYKLNEIDNKVYGLPILPKKYRQLLRTPIDTEIIKIGERKIHQEKFDDGTVNYEMIYRFVTLGAGKDKKIKIGMNFFIEDLNEWIEITEVLSNSSTGRIIRGFDENGKEDCRELEHGQGIGTPCKEIKVGMKARTKTSEF